MNAEARHWVVVPAAGSGRRMGADTPKQYLALAGKTIIEHTLDRLLGLAFLEGVVVALSADDQRFADLAVARHPRLYRVIGGTERSDSVYAGLLGLADLAADQDWVWVHDAARPCLAAADVQALRDALATEPGASQGAILATPAADTVKQADERGCISVTLDRSRLWLAQTPQVFRLGALRAALERARRDAIPVTDEASAIEYSGGAPLLVAGDRGNIKITTPSDLRYAAAWLTAEDPTCA